ncbi:S41 family peptidase [Deinococcus arenicola]|uniref:S41 family peptidase n=1 Tax=Deinococcus arenicola TaxID=2994950 RepID=A0ABU4DRV4_9DEIO|nr:S41 family peptidase [Deinococcus sp. ZS9-10]MDV6374419.1 S41 family peptidase [Deinococcus sp. ZS9-10]
MKLLARSSAPRRVVSGSPLLARMGRAVMLGSALLLSGAMGDTGAQAASSPAQLAFNRVNHLIQDNYGGLSTVDRVVLSAEYQKRLDAVCSASLASCTESKAYPVIQAEVTALGDEHSYFQTPEDFKEFSASASGGNRLQFGVKLSRLDGENRVVSEVVPGSAAESAGLMRGDLLLTIDGLPYTFAGLKTAKEGGKPMTLGLTRRGVSVTTTLTSRESSTRDLPRISYVPAATPVGMAATTTVGEVAVLRIPTFLSGGGVAQQVHDLVGQAQRRGASGLVVDLRGNGGGSLYECDSGVSAFVPSVTRIARSADGNQRTLVSRGTILEDGRVASSVRSPKLWAGPLAVLVDGGSASCSEFFAHEIQYAGRGPVIGETTAGVGNTATRIFKVGDGALQLTILNYAKPDGTPYPTRIIPDQPFAQGEEQIRHLTQGQDDLLNDGVQALAKAPVLTLDPMRNQP